MTPVGDMAVMTRRSLERDDHGGMIIWHDNSMTLRGQRIPLVRDRQGTLEALKWLQVDFSLTKEGGDLGNATLKHR